MVTAYGALETATDVDERGRVKQSAAAMIRALRVAEAWERYDSVIVGQGAEALDPGFFENFSAFAQADSLRWFSQRASAVGRAYTNQRTERTDWAQDLYFFGIQFYAPPGMGDKDDAPNDTQFWPSMWVKQLAAMMSFRITIAESDEVLVIPGDSAPSGRGVANVFADGSAAPFFNPGTEGIPVLANRWKFPEPIMLPAQAKITVEARVDQPMRAFMSQFTTEPRFKAVLNSATNEFVQLRNFFFIRCSFMGPRYLQFRGARTAA